MSSPTIRSASQVLLERARSAHVGELERLIAAFVVPLPPGSDARDGVLEGLAMELWREWTPAALPLLRALIRLEVLVRREVGGCGEALRLLCFLLHLHGERGDVALIYGAKMANFDTGCSIDLPLLTMNRSRTEMVAFVEGAGSPALRDAVLRAFDASDYACHADYLDEVQHYYGL